jgi:hypothetical protein
MNQLGRRISEDASECFVGHRWSPILVHVSTRGRVTSINERPFTHETAYFRLCNYFEGCVFRRSNCRFAHSAVERDVWYLQRDSECTWKDIVDKVKSEFIMI